MMREMTVGQDAEFSLPRFESRYRADLGNDLGNLVSRLLHMIRKYSSGRVPEVSLNEKCETSLQTNWEKTRENVMEAFDGNRFSQGLDQLFGFFRLINKYAEERSPWKLAKSEKEEDQRALYTSLSVMSEALRLGNVLLQPIMPMTSEKINRLFGLPNVVCWAEELDWGERLTGKEVGEKQILFPRD